MREQANNTMLKIKYNEQRKKELKNNNWKKKWKNVNSEHQHIYISVDAIVYSFRFCLTRKYQKLRIHGIEIKDCSYITFEKFWPLLFRIFICSYQSVCIYHHMSGGFLLIVYHTIQSISCAFFILILYKNLILKWNIEFNYDFMFWMN